MFIFAATLMKIGIFSQLLAPCQYYFQAKRLATALKRESNAGVFL